MRILVTGGCGFIGSHIADAYIKLGHNVSIIDNLSTGEIQNLNPRAQFFEKDIGDKTIENIFKKEQFDIINHHAAQINVRTSVDDPLFDARVNIMGSLHLINLAIKYRVKRFIFASSGGTVYGEPDRFPITEDFTINPNSPYGISKATVERYLVFFAGLYNLDYVILRYSNVYGPRQISKSEAGVISIFIEQILHNKKCIVFGDGTQIRDYVCVDDVVKANIAALDCESDIFNIGTGIETGVNDLIDILSEIIGKQVDYVYDAPRPGDIFKNVVDASKAASKISWVPQITLKQGIKKTFGYFSQLNAARKNIS
jgi:UDP-glucose 4-epimerase